MGITASILETLDGWLADGVPVAYIEAACEQARLQGGHKPPKYVEAIIRRYQAQGSTADARKPAAAPGAPSAPAAPAAVNTGAGLFVSTAATLTDAEIEAGKRWEAEHPDEMRELKERRHG